MGDTRQVDIVTGRDSLERRIQKRVVPRHEDACDAEAEDLQISPDVDRLVMDRELPHKILH